VANQAIALQARAPQSNFLGGAIQQNAQMMNMLAQQRAAERQTAVAAQEMAIARAKEGREASAAEIDMAGKKIDFYTKRAGQTMTPEGYSLLLKDLDRDAPEIAAAFRANLPEANFDRNTLLRMVGSISDNFRATYGPLETEVVQMKDGTYAVARTGGFGKPGVFQLEEFQLAPSGAAPTQTPTAPARAPMSAPAARATDAQIDEAARKIIRGAGVGELGISMEDFDRASERANQMTAGGGARMQPISMTTGPQMGGQPDMAAVVQDMMSSGQISQSNLQLMRDMAGPDKDAQLAEILKANNIQIVPDEQPSMRSAVFRPGEGAAPQTRSAVFRPGEDAAPQMQLAQSMEDYRPTGRPARGKDPMQSPAPGSALVPTPVIREQAEAERPSEKETYTKKRAEEQAAADVKFLESAPAAIETVSNNLRLLDRMIGDARVNEKTGEVIYPPKGRKPHPGFESVVGVGFPGLRFVPGSSEADFDALFKQVTGAAFLEAFETLKGGGQITEKEGEKATQAISRLGRNISEKEFIIATNELRSIMRRGLERAEARRARLKGGAAPASGERRTPTKSKAKQLRYNPATGDFE
jgi:hypothetical protein